MINTCKIICDKHDGVIRDVQLDGVSYGHAAYSASIRQDGPLDIPELTLKIHCLRYEFIYQDD